MEAVIPGRNIKKSRVVLLRCFVPFLKKTACRPVDGCRFLHLPGARIPANLGRHFRPASKLFMGQVATVCPGISPSQPAVKRSAGRGPAPPLRSIRAADGPFFRNFLTSQVTQPSITLAGRNRPSPTAFCRLGLESNSLAQGTRHMLRIIAENLEPHPTDCLFGGSGISWAYGAPPRHASRKSVESDYRGHAFHRFLREVAPAPPVGRNYSKPARWGSVGIRQRRKSTWNSACHHPNGSSPK